MPESKFLQTFRKVFREHPEMFTALEEYDKTGKLPKIKYKTRANFTIDADLLRRFRTYCKKEGYNMSKLIEKHLQEELKKAK